MDGGFDEYYENISDHRPVALKLYFGSSMFGDVNQDDLVNILDIVMTVTFILDNEFNEFADLNGDGNVDVVDVILIVNIILG